MSTRYQPEEESIMAIILIEEVLMGLEEQTSDTVLSC